MTAPLPLGRTVGRLTNTERKRFYKLCRRHGVELTQHRRAVVGCWLNSWDPALEEPARRILSDALVQLLAKGAV